MRLSFRPPPVGGLGRPFVVPGMAWSDYHSNYQNLLAELLKHHSRDRAMELVVGGDFERTGKLERALLVAAGLRPEHRLIDVGCGSGRLAWALRDFVGSYLGTDVLGDALAYARERVRRPDWHFVETRDSIIPASEASADMVCFFSVFTHLLDEDIFRFLEESRRVLVTGGRIVFSFLEFECISHWTVFQNTVADRNPNRVLNKFLSRSAIHRMIAELGMTVEAFHGGEEPWIPFIELDTGRPTPAVVAFGQSIAILRKPPDGNHRG